MTGRKYSRFADATYSAHQHSYIKGRGRNKAWLIVSAATSLELECSFTKLRNEANITTAVDSVIPSSVINSSWIGRRRCLYMKALSANPTMQIEIQPTDDTNHPAHTDDDPSAARLIPTQSATDGDSHR